MDAYEAEGLTAPAVLPADDALDLLERGRLSIEGRVAAASNATLYCRVELDGVAAACVYKPVSGERPLWDYPSGTLAEREFATYLTSAATGWDLVPPTVLRDGPAGPGMVQLWIDEDDDYDIISAINSGESAELQRMALLDAIVNNSDRKVSHLLPVARPDGEPHHIYGVDHGVSFSVQSKLRTVLWQWAGVRIPSDLLDVLDKLDQDLAGPLGDSLSALLTTTEVRAARRRVRDLRTESLFPLPPTDWPAVPYPPY
jgi:uncharacterized repeat protein (TIGR03843 family)